jgi:hypothetical protein
MSWHRAAVLSTRRAMGTSGTKHGIIDWPACAVIIPSGEPSSAAIAYRYPT